MRKNKSDPISYGQSIVEYVILIAIISAALLAMQTYAQRGIQGVIRVAADQVGKQEDSWEEVKQEDKDYPQLIYSTNNETGRNSSTVRERTTLGGGHSTDTDESSSGTSIGVSESRQIKND